MKDSERERVTRGDSVIENVNLDEEEYFVIGPEGEAVRYTEADAERDAAKAEAAYHRARARHLVPGGKSLSGDGSHSPRLQTVVASETKKELDRRAKARGMSTSKYTRQLIEEYLAEHPA